MFIKHQVNISHPRILFQNQKVTEVSNECISFRTYKDIYIENYLFSCVWTLNSSLGIHNS